MGILLLLLNVTLAFAAEPSLSCASLSARFASLADPEKRYQQLLKQPQSPEHWAAYDAEFVANARDTIATAYPIYQTAVRNGDAHARWLKAAGFHFSPNPAEVKVPPLRELLIQHERKLQALIRKGFPPEQTIRPARVYKNTGGDLAYFPYGAKVPDGYHPMTEIIPVPYTLKMLDEGYLPLGESLFMNSASVRGKITFSLHDYAHHAAHLDHPEYMAALRDLGRRLREQRAFFPRLRYPSQDFTNEEVAQLLEMGAIPSFAFDHARRKYPDQTGKLSQLTEFLNQTDPWTKEHLATQLTKDSIADNARKNMGLRLAVYLENASLVDAKNAERFRLRQEKRGFLPKKETGATYTADELTYFLENHSVEQLEDELRRLTKEFPRLLTRYGGGLRDIVQASERLKGAREGYSQFFSIDALYPQARAVLANPYAGKGRLMVMVGKLQAAVLEAGRVNIADWGSEITKPKLDRNSALYHFLCKAGVFERDAYWVAHCE